MGKLYLFSCIDCVLMVVQSVACQVTSLKIKYNPFAKAFQDNKDRFDVCVCV